MGAPRALYRPTPGGTMVIWLGAGPSRLSLRPPSSPPTTGAHRLVGPVDWPGMEPTGLVRRGRVLPAADYCSRASNDAGLVMGSWQQCRRLTGDHYSHSLSCLVNGVWGPWEEPADSREPTPMVCLQGAHAVFCLPTDRQPRRPWAVQASIVGTVRRPLWLRSGQAWQQYRASPEIFSDTAYCSHAGPL